MYKHILNFINKDKILNQNQFGYSNNHSTFMALIILDKNLGNVQLVYFGLPENIRFTMWIFHRRHILDKYHWKKKFQNKLSLFPINVKSLPKHHG